MLFQGDIRVLGHGELEGSLVHVGGLRAVDDIAVGKRRGILREHGDEGTGGDFSFRRVADAFGGAGESAAFAGHLADDAFIHLGGRGGFLFRAEADGQVLTDIEEVDRILGIFGFKADAVDGPAFDRLFRPDGDVSRIREGQGGNRRVGRRFTHRIDRDQEGGGSGDRDVPADITGAFALRIVRRCGFSRFSAFGSCFSRFPAFSGFSRLSSFSGFRWKVLSAWLTSSGSSWNFSQLIHPT